MLKEPKADVAWIKDNKETILGIGTFADTPEGCTQHYGKWAKDYDHIVEKIGMNDHFMLARELADQPKGRLLDFGCGTGLTGVELRKVGFELIDGNDGAKDMLPVCGAKQVYKDLRQLFIGVDPMPEDYR